MSLLRPAARRKRPRRELPWAAPPGYLWPWTVAPIGGAGRLPGPTRGRAPVAVRPDPAGHPHLHVRGRPGRDGPARRVDPGPRPVLPLLPRTPLSRRHAAGHIAAKIVAVAAAYATDSIVPDDPRPKPDGVGDHRRQEGHHAGDKHKPEHRQERGPGPERDRRQVRQPDRHGQEVHHRQPRGSGPCLSRRQDVGCRRGPAAYFVLNASVCISACESQAGNM